MARNQRQRILAAVAAETSATSYGSMTVDSIITRAGVSRRTFYENFGNKHEAFLAAYDAAVARLAGQVATAVDAVETFAERAQAGLGVLLDFIAADPSVARMCIVDVLAAGPDGIARRRTSVRAFAALVDHHAHELLEDPAPPLTAETVVGGVYEVISTRVQRDEAESLPSLLPDLAYSALLPYLGESAARSERRRIADERSAAG